jgi:hypothetical protein
MELQGRLRSWHGRLARESHGHLGRESGRFCAATGETPVVLMGETPMPRFHTHAPRSKAAGPVGPAALDWFERKN